MGFCCFLFLCCEASSPRILPVCFAAFAFANILMFTYQKKNKTMESFLELVSHGKVTYVIGILFLKMFS